MKMTLTAERLRELLDYDKETGAFTWKVRPSQRVKAGDAAGCVFTNGRVYISISGKSYLAHRLAWLHVHGQWPAGEIDHCDEVPTHNWISNLRDVGRLQNMQNKSQPQVNNKLGIRGVHKVGNRYVVLLRTNGERMEIGRFDTPSQAHKAYLNAKCAHHEAFIPKGEL